MSLKSRTTSGIFWFIVANSSTQFANFLVFVLLARDLPLEVFGLVMFALLVCNYFLIFVKEGVSDYLVQHPEWNPDAVSSAFWLMAIGGLALTAVCAFVVAPILGTVVDPLVTTYLQVLSPTIFIGALSAVNFAKARREFKFKLTAGRSFFTGVVTAVVALVLAFFQFGAWSLIISRLVGAFGATVLLLLAEPVKPRMRVSLAEVKAIASYCHPIFSSRSVGFLAFKAADLFLIALLGPAALAIYRVGTRIWEAITVLLVHPIMTVAMSTFSRVPRSRLGETFIRMTAALAAIFLPIYFGAAAIGTNLTVVVFGEAWRESGMIMTLLCLAATPQLVRALVPAALKAINATPQFFRFSSIEAGSSIFWSALTAPFGPVVLAVGTFIDPHLAILLNRKTLKTEVGVPIGKLTSAIAPFFVSALTMFAGVVALQHWLSHDYDPLALLALSVVSGAGLYLATLLVFARSVSRQLIADTASLIPARLSFALNMANWAFQPIAPRFRRRKVNGTKS